MKITTFNFRGACCANGIIRAKKAIATVSDTEKVTIDLSSHLAVVEGEANPDAVVEALIGAGFDASITRTD